jgi:hypothetical protein
VEVIPVVCASVVLQKLCVRDFGDSPLDLELVLGDAELFDTGFEPVFGVRGRLRY